MTSPLLTTIHRIGERMVSRVITAQASYYGIDPVKMTIAKIKDHPDFFAERAAYTAPVFKYPPE